MSTEAITNREFATRVGVTFSYASYLKSGSRSPSADVLIRIIEAFDLEPREAMRAHREGASAFGRYLRDTVYAGKTSREPDESVATNSSQ